jgi:hypothetical protein
MTQMRKRWAFGLVVAVALAGLVGVVDPAGASTPTVSKTTGLRFYEQVTVHAESTPGAEFFADQCFVQNGSSVLGCADLVRMRVPASGVVDVPAVLTRRIEVRDNTTGVTSILDCTASGFTCNVTVAGASANAVIPIAFDPSAPIPAVSVTPSSNLGWSSAATVHGTGFVPGQELWVTQCARWVDRSYLYSVPTVHCVGVKDAPHATADSSGAFTVPAVTRRLVPPDPGGSFEPWGSADCVQPGVECFERVLLPPAPGATDRVAIYGKGPIDTGLAFADDGIPVVLVKKNILQTEHHTAVRIRVDLTGPAPSPLTVEYSTGSVPPPLGDGSATAGSDYVAKMSRLHFLPGETHHVITITLLDDTVSEPYEVFAVRYAGAFHANTRATVIRIANDDH